MTRPGGVGPQPPRRELVIAILLCLAGAALAFWAARRAWVVEVTPRPEPLPALRTERTGADLVPLVPALAVVGLAGAGAVLATRGRVRRVVGALLVLVGLGIAAAAAYAQVALPLGAAAPTGPVLSLLGGLLAAGGGAVTAVRGGTWPGLGARYESPHRRPGTERRPASEPERVTGGSAAAAWEALDRGEDPTDR